MANRLTYEELVQRIKELEKEAAKHKKIYETLRESEECLKAVEMPQNLPAAATCPAKF
jgi:hypothetical protein